MAAYKIFVKKSVSKDLASIPKRDAQKIIKKIQSLVSDPRPNGCEKLTGDEKYRVRQGNYRIIYSIQDNELIVWVVKIGHRKEIYR